MSVLVRPLPAGDIGLIDSVPEGIVAACNLLVPKFFLGVGPYFLQLWDALNGIHRQIETIDLVFNRKQSNHDTLMLLGPRRYAIGQLQ